MCNYLGQNSTRHNACGSTSTFHVQDVPIGGYTLIKLQSTHRPAEVQYYLDQALDRFLQHSPVGYVFWRQWLGQDGRKLLHEALQVWLDQLPCLLTILPRHRLQARDERVDDGQCLLLHLVAVCARQADDQLQFW